MKSLKKNKITQFTRKISEAARFFGADMVGIASVERFEKAPKGFHPKDLMSNAKSVLIMGKYFPLGVLKGNSKAAVTRVYETLFIALDQCAYRLSTLIENQGGQHCLFLRTCPTILGIKGNNVAGEISHTDTLPY
jgi:hypothetical protein